MNESAPPAVSVAGLLVRVELGDALRRPDPAAIVSLHPTVQQLCRDRKSSQDGDAGV
ncbi:MAG TPA: hypothetical protein VJ808_13910 [Gemmatimonadales bacterium]|nr:hypothetical protein [Gemmatimonadales bacterium]